MMRRFVSPAMPFNTEPAQLGAAAVPFIATIVLVIAVRMAPRSAIARPALPPIVKADANAGLIAIPNTLLTPESVSLPASARDAGSTGPFESAPSLYTEPVFLEGDPDVTIPVVTAIVGRASPRALINGRVRGPGDTIDELWRLESIDPSARSVTLRDTTGRRVIRTIELPPLDR